MRDPYYCPYCDQRSTRRWNLEIHIKRKHGGYSLGRSSDLYMTNNAPLHSQSVMENATIANGINDTFHPTFLPQQRALGTSQYSTNPIFSPVNVSQTFANPVYRPMQIMDDQINQSGLSQVKILKIQELKLLMNKYSYYHTNPDEIIRLAIYNSINSDDTLLDRKLEQLRSLDSLANIKF